MYVLYVKVDLPLLETVHPAICAGPWSVRTPLATVLAKTLYFSRYSQRLAWYWWCLAWQLKNITLGLVMI